MGPNSVVLDAGCGYRNQLFSDKDVKLLIGCDINLSAIKDNNDISSGVLADIEMMSFRENIFDLIISFDVIEHLRKPNAFIKEAARVLKNDGGTLFLITPNQNSILGLAARIIPHRIKDGLNRYFRGCHVESQIHMYRLNSFTHMLHALKANGLKHIHLIKLNRLPSNPRMRRLLLPFYHLCKIRVFRRFSNSILCIGTKTADL